MQFLYDDSSIYYQVFEGADCVLFLHGWGANVFPKSLIYRLSNNGKKIVDTHFLGFGKSSMPPRVYSVQEYAQSILALLDFLGVHSCAILAHSFGCRVALYLAAHHKDRFCKMLLCGAAGLIPRRGLKYRLRVYLYKRAKKLGLNLDSFGSADYKNLDGNMKKTFVNVVNCDCKQWAKQVECEVTLVFGSKDKDTPLYMARRLKRYIKHSKLHIMKNCGHFCFLDNEQQFCNLAQIALA